MIKDYAMITLGVLTLLVTSGAVYGILTINTQIQAKPEQQLKIPDYTAELDSLKSQVDSINTQVGAMSNTLATLDTLKSNVADMNSKLTDLESKSTTVTQPVSYTPTASLAVVLDKSTYLQTDTIQITAVGANPQKTVQIELLDSTGFVVLHKTTWSDSSGKVSYQMQLSTALPVGSYQVQVISDQQTGSQAISIVAANTSTTTTGSGPFTAQTDKTTYNNGDFIQVIGAGQAGTSITGVLTSPTGKTYSTATTIQSDGSYVMFFSPTQPYEIGNWSIAVTNLGQTKTLTIYVSTGTSTGSTTLTAQTDKSTYNLGDYVKVSGTGQPNTSITVTISSPSGITHPQTSIVNSDGSYSIAFYIPTTYETGTWSAYVTNNSQSKTITFYLQT